MELLDFLLVLNDNIQIQVYKSCFSVQLVNKQVHEIDMFDFKIAKRYVVSEVVNCDENCIKVIAHAKIGN